MKRRELLKLMAAFALGTAGSMALAADKRMRCLPRISGPLWWLDPESARWSESEWRDELDRQHRIGFDLLWLLNAPSDVDGLQTILDLCARRKVQVILDTGSSSLWYNRLDIKKELDICGRNIERIGQRFKGHPAFYAWYVPHEIYMCWGEFAAYMDELYPRLAEKCKASADLPVTVSPFFILDRDKVFGDFRFNEPDEYQAYWARLIRKSGLDIVMLQDSGEHFSYVTNDQRRPFFQAMANACRQSGARFWGNVETAEFECPSIEEYVRRYGRIHHSAVKNAPWRPVPIQRLKEKLALAAEYSDRIVTWGYKEYCCMSPGWIQDYRTYLDSSI